MQDDTSKAAAQKSLVIHQRLAGDQRQKSTVAAGDARVIQTRTPVLWPHALPRRNIYKINNSTSTPISRSDSHFVADLDSSRLTCDDFVRNRFSLRFIFYQEFAFMELHALIGRRRRWKIYHVPRVGDVNRRTGEERKARENGMETERERVKKVEISSPRLKMLPISTTRIF